MTTEYTMENIRENLGLDPYDESKDSEIAEMSKDEQFERFMNWEGIIGYEETIKNAIEDIYGVILD